MYNYQSPQNREDTDYCCPKAIWYKVRRGHCRILLPEDIFTYPTLIYKYLKYPAYSEQMKYEQMSHITNDLMAKCAVKLSN